MEKQPFYTVPEVEIIEISVEKGFAQSHLEDPEYGGSL